MRRSREAQRPAEGDDEHFHRLRGRRFSVYQREEPNQSPKVDPRQLEQRPIELAAPQHTSPVSGRRQSSALEKGSSVYNADMGKPLVPEKSTLRRHSHTQSTRSVGKVIPQEPVKGVVPPTVQSIAYEPGHILRENAEYFDLDQDGIIWLKDTYRGYRKLGWGIPASCLSTFLIHSMLSYPTCLSYAPDWYLRIHYDSAHHGQHSAECISDGGKGQRGLDQVCEEIIARYDGDHKGGLTFRDIMRFCGDQRSTMSSRGWSVTVLEWLSLYALLHPRPPPTIIRNEDIRAAFNGSVLYKRSEAWRRQKTEQFPRRSENQDRSRGRIAAVERVDPVKLAMVIIAGLAIVVWVLLNLAPDIPRLATYWWEKDDIQRGPS